MLRFRPDQTLTSSPITPPSTICAVPCLKAWPRIHLPHTWPLTWPFTIGHTHGWSPWTTDYSTLPDSPGPPPPGLPQDPITYHQPGQPSQAWAKRRWSETWKRRERWGFTERAWWTCVIYESKSKLEGIVDNCEGDYFNDFLKFL